MLNYIRGTADTFNTILYPGQWITVRFCYVIYFPKINTKTDEACQTYQPSNRESSELELGSASPCSCHVANLSLQTAVFVRINTVWMCALGDRLRLIMLWDGRSRGYIRKQHLICQNQLHNVYNVDRCISNSKKLFFFDQTGFPPYHTGSWSWSPFWPVSLQKLLSHIMKVQVSDEFWLIFAIDREFKRCWLSVIHSSFFILAAWHKERSASQFVRNILKALEKTKSNMMFSVVDGDKYLNRVSLLANCWLKYQSAQACVVISFPGINKSPIQICQILVGRQVMSKTAT